jgi:hypothetical protein
MEMTNRNDIFQTTLIAIRIDCCMFVRMLSLVSSWWLKSFNGTSKVNKQMNREKLHLMQKRQIDAIAKAINTRLGSSHEA